MSFRWTIESTEKLQDYMARGRTYPEIAVLLNDEFKTTYNASSVGKRASRLKSVTSISDIHWPQVMKDRLGELYKLPKALSYKDLTERLNSEFNTTYSRCAVIAQTKRMGLTGKAPASSASYNKPRLRIVSANGNSNAKRVFKPVSVDLPALRCVEIVPLGKTLLELEVGECRYPYGDVSFTFCGHPVKIDSSWCPAHHALCLLPNAPSARPTKKYFGTDFARRA